MYRIKMQPDPYKDMTICLSREFRKMYKDLCRVCGIAVDNAFPYEALCDTCKSWYLRLHE